MYSTVLWALMVALCLISITNVQAAKIGDGKGKPGNQSIPGDFYTWDLDFTSGATAEQTAFVSSDDNSTLVTSTILESPDNTSTLANAKIMIDASYVIATRFVGPRPICYLSNLDQKYVVILEDAKDTNDTQISVTDEIFMNATDDPMSRDQMKQLFTSAPAIKRFCKGSKMVLVNQIPENATVPETDVQSTLTLAGQVNYLVPKNRGKPYEKPNKPSGKPNNPSKKPTRPSGKPNNPSKKPTRPSGKPNNPSKKPTRPPGIPNKPIKRPAIINENPNNPFGNDSNPSLHPSSFMRGIAGLGPEPQLGNGNETSTNGTGNNSKPDKGNGKKSSVGKKEKPGKGNGKKPSGGKNDKPGKSNGKKPSGGNNNKPEKLNGKKPSGGNNNKPEKLNGKKQSGGKNNKPEKLNGKKQSGGKNNKPEKLNGKKPSGGKNNKPEKLNGKKQSGGKNSKPGKANRKKSSGEKKGRPGKGTKADVSADTSD